VGLSSAAEDTRARRRCESAAAGRKVARRRGHLRHGRDGHAGKWRLGVLRVDGGGVGQGAADDTRAHNGGAEVRPPGV
jgi:hypothetical protein